LVNYTLGFWYGAKLISDQALDQGRHDNSGGYTVGDLIVIFFSIYSSNLSLSTLPEYITGFSVSRVEVRKISAIIDRKPRVVQGKEEASKNIDEICFENVLFQYENPLFKNFNLRIKKGITAFIGSSGSGKTTIINLIMRFYDIFEGKIYF
jgi:ABC-type multidrug transport system fused ATPase/permease subunit